MKPVKFISTLLRELCNTTSLYPKKPKTQPTMKALNSNKLFTLLFLALVASVLVLPIGCNPPCEAPVSGNINVQAGPTQDTITVTWNGPKYAAQSHAISIKDTKNIINQSDINYETNYFKIVAPQHLPIGDTITCQVQARCNNTLSPPLHLSIIIKGDPIATINILPRIIGPAQPSFCSSSCRYIKLESDNTIYDRACLCSCYNTNTQDFEACKNSCIRTPTGATRPCSILEVQ
jgi:hypothetical protein